MKRTTQAHLAVARENLTALATQADRRKLADHLQGYRKWFGSSEARRRHRTLYGPLLD